MRARRWAVWTAVAGTVFIAIGAFWLSFTSLADLAARSGIGAGQAWAWPLIVDGIIVVATVAVVALAGQKAAWYPWALLAAAIAAVPPVVLLAITHLTVILTHTTDSQPVIWQTVTQQHDRPTPGPGPGIESGRPPAALPGTVSAHPIGADDEPVTSPAPDPAAEHAEEAPEADRSAPPDCEGSTGPDVSASGTAGVGRRERAAGLRSEGWSNKQIAAELGVHPSTVGRWLTSTPTRSPEPDTNPSMKETS